MSSSEKRRRVLGADALDGLVPSEVPAQPVVPAPVASPVPAPAAAVPVVPAPVASATTAPSHATLPRVEPREEPSPQTSAPRSRTAQAKAAVTTRAKITFSLPDDLLEECRNAVDFLSGPPTRLTFAALVERALRRELASLRGKHCEGNAFPSREGPLRTGRPLRS